MNKTVRILAMALSFATLLFLLPIKSALFPTVGLRSWAVDISFYEVSAALFLVIISALLFAVLFVLSHRIEDRRASTEVRLLFVLVTCAVYGSLSFELVNWFYIIDRSMVYCILPIAILVSTALATQRSGFLATKWEEAVGATLLFLAPAALLLNIQLVTHLFSAEVIRPTSVEQPKAATVDEPDGPKVVWIIFDELDYAAFTQRPEGIRTPAFDQLMANSFVGTSAYPPAQRTQESIPSLLYGRIFPEYQPSMLESWSAFGGRAEKDYFRTEETSLVHDVNQMNKRAAVVGWYLPYERLFGDENTFGEWTYFRKERCQYFVECVTLHLNLAVSGLPIRNPLPSTSDSRQLWERFSANQRQRNRFIVSQAKTLVSNKNYSLKLIHLSVPHYPYVGTGRTMGRPTYFDNIELADQNLEEILVVFGVLNDKNTNLIVTSDHWWRDKTREDFSHLPESEGAAAFADSRVPFIVKLAGSDEKVVYDRPFNTVLLRRLINAILKGEIRSNAEVSDFISSDTERFPSDAAYRANRVQLPKSN